MPGFIYERQRIMRILWPSRYDHSAYMLVKIVGGWWFLLTGWKREYKILSDHGYIVIDLAQPRLKLALEADGERYHFDIVREQRRNERLKELGWSVRHFRYPRLKNEPRRVRREVRGWFYRALLWNIKR